MFFGVLGPLEVRDGEAPVTLAGTKPRKLLARLLVDANSAVSVDALADALWTSGEALPENPPATIQVYVSNLRRALGRHVIRTSAPGYVLDLDGHTCDARQLVEWVASARTLRAEGHADGAIAASRRAIDLSRGEPYGDVAYEDWAQAAVRELTETLLSAHDELHAALTAAERDEEAVPLLEAFSAKHPYRERARGQLMLAFYRTGRQADALRAYTQGRDAMVEALGVEPGSELQQLQTRILDQDPDLLPTPREVLSSPVPIVAVESTIVGRVQEQRRISAALSRAERGEIQVVLVDGPAGIGKSALGHWASGHAAARSHRTATGRAHDLDGAPPFWPWTRCLQALEVADSIQSPGDSPFLLFADVCDRLAEATLEQPMLAVLDDMQWADRTSIELLKFLARAPISARLTVVATYRGVPADHPLSLLAADLSTERSVTRLRLEPLEAADVSELVHRLTGQPVEPDVTDAIAQRTGGNPFFVEELVRVMDSGDGSLDVGAASVPRTVAELVRRRAEALSADAVAVLTVASFLAGPFSAELPAALSGHDENAARAVFEAAVAEGILADEPRRIGWWAFAHELIRHAFYDPVPAVTRASTHLRIGEEMAASLGDAASDAAPELAAHFGQAASVGGAEPAVRWSRVAADRAIVALAYEDAVRYLRRALFVTRRELNDRALECDVLLDLAGAARLAADQPTATRASERAAVLAEELDDPFRAERARTPMLRRRAIVRSQRSVTAALDPSDHDASAVDVDDRAITTVLFTDIVSSTERLAAAGDEAWRQVLDHHDGVVERLVSNDRGRVIKSLGDGMLATFEGPAHAVRCAGAIRDAMGEQGIAVRAGLHTGEIELRDHDISGIAVHIASRVSALAGPGEILASRTVVDLTAGSGIAFEARGDHRLKGIPGSWPIFAVTSLG